MPAKDRNIPFHVHIPFPLLRSHYLSLVTEKRLNPEIAFNQTTLKETSRQDFISVANQLGDAGLAVTFHAPFLDLRPGALDEEIRQVTKERIRQVFDLAPYFRPLSVVCHPSFDAKYYVGAEKQWLDNSLETWSYFAALAEETGTQVVLENVYEKDPTQLHLLLSNLNSPRVGFCLDAGHFNVFSRTELADWMALLGPYLKQMHLHDNNGLADMHLPVGEGNFPFPSLLTKLNDCNSKPIITLEAHSEEHLWRTIKNFQALTQMQD